MLYVSDYDLIKNAKVTALMPHLISYLYLFEIMNDGLCTKHVHVI